MPGFTDGGGGSSGGGGGVIGGGGGGGTPGTGESGGKHWFTNSSLYDLSGAWFGASEPEPWDSLEVLMRLLRITEAQWRAASHATKQALKQRAKQLINAAKQAKRAGAPGDVFSIAEAAGEGLDPQDILRGAISTGPFSGSVFPGVGIAESGGGGQNVQDILNSVIQQNTGLLGVLQAINQNVFGTGGSSILGGGTAGGGTTTGGGMANGLDWGTIALLLGGGALEGAGSFLGGQAAADAAQIRPSRQQIAGFDPRADPLLAALSAQGLAGIGVGPDLNIMGAASPVNRLENTLLNSLGGQVKGQQLTLLNQAIQALHAGVPGEEVMAAFENAKGKIGKSGKKAMELLQTALTAGGFSGIDDLLAQEQAYQAQAQFLTAGLQGPALERFGARNAANASINQILSDYPVVTQGGFDEAVAGALEPYHAQELEQANALGYNPATNLALTRQAGIRDALSILSGRQGLANNALVGLQGSLSAQDETARGTSAQSLAAIANSSNLASEQALALNQLAASGQLAGAQATGTGIQGGLGALGQSAQLFGLLNLLGAQPGTAPRSNLTQADLDIYNSWGQ